MQEQRKHVDIFLSLSCTKQLIPFVYTASKTIRVGKIANYTETYLNVGLGRQTVERATVGGVCFTTLPMTSFWQIDSSQLALKKIMSNPPDWATRCTGDNRLHMCFEFWAFDVGEGCDIAMPLIRLIFFQF